MALASDADTEGRLNKNGPSNMMAAWQGSAIRKKKRQLKLMHKSLKLAVLLCPVTADTQSNSTNSGSGSWYTWCMLWQQQLHWVEQTARHGMPILPFEVCSLFASLNQKWVADIQPAMGTLVRCYLTKDWKTRMSYHIKFFSLFILLRQYTPDHPAEKYTSGS